MLKVNRVLNVICLILILFSAIRVEAQEIRSGDLEKSGIPGSINEDNYIEKAPSIRADGELMIIKSNRNGPWQFFESDLRSGGTWSEPRALKNINAYGDTAGLTGNPFISYDGNTLYFSASYEEGYGSEDIYYSIREENEWTEPKNIGQPVNTTAYEGFPSVSYDGSALYFVRSRETDNLNLDRNFTETCFEIVVSSRDRDGEWSAPRALPYPVNYKCDMFPRIMADNKTLIFSSYRPGSGDSYALYQSRINDEGDWSGPVRLDFVNTVSGDQIVCQPASGERLFYGDQGDIYSIPVPENLRQFNNAVIKGYVREGGIQKGVEAKINVWNSETYEKLFSLYNNAFTGNYSLVLPLEGLYAVEFSREGFTSADYFYDFRSTKSYEMIDRDVLLFSRIQLRLNVKDKELFEPLPATIIIRKSGGSEIFQEIKNNADQGYSIIELPVGEAYSITAKLGNFKSDTMILDISNPVKYRKIERDLEMMPVKTDVPVHAIDINTYKEIVGRILIKNLFLDETFEMNANEMAALRTGNRYEIKAMSDKGYFYVSSILNVGSNGISVEGGANDFVGIKGRQLEFRLTPIEVGTTFVLQEVLFQNQSARLNDTSYEELERIVDTMKKNPTMRAEIAVHTYALGTEEYNKDLTQRRAQCIADYLIASGIRKNRLTARGYGASRPVSLNSSPESRLRNRRVELRVTEVLN